MVAKMKGKSGYRPQIGVPIPERHIQERFSEIVKNHFDSNMAEFLRDIVRQVVATYSEVERSEAIALGLDSEIYGRGPVLFRRVYSDWKAKHPDMEKELKAEIEREAQAKSKKSE